jgi:hypothetical protein
MRNTELFVNVLSTEKLKIVLQMTFIKLNTMSYKDRTAELLFTAVDFFPVFLLPGDFGEDFAALFEAPAFGVFPFGVRLRTLFAITGNVQTTC